MHQHFKTNPEVASKAHTSQTHTLSVAVLVQGGPIHSSLHVYACAYLEG